MRGRSLRSALVSLAAAACSLWALPAGAAAAPIALGAYVPDYWKDPALIDRYARQVGAPPALLLTFKDWDVPPFSESELNEISRRGAVPLVTWEPWDTSRAGPPGRGYSLQSIVAGKHDRYIGEAAGAAAQWGRPILLRFAHEMNGGWAPWGAGVKRNTPADYRDAWRRIVSIFRQRGADNVEWVWSVNVDNEGRFPFEQFYPGDAWVDWTAIDGYNWGGEFGWVSFTELFATTYEELSRLAGKPILITETGSGEDDGDKAAWIRSALARELPRFPNIRGLVWFNAPDPKGDVRVDSSAEAVAALREASRLPEYRASAAQLLGGPAAVPREVEAPAAPGDGYGEPSLLERIEQKLGGAAWVAASLALALLLAVAALLALRVRRRTRPAGP
jgi:hypothetical protein